MNANETSIISERTLKLDQVKHMSTNEHISIRGMHKLCTPMFGNIYSPCMAEVLLIAPQMVHFSSFDHLVWSKNSNSTVEPLEHLH